jgi:porin
VTRSISIHALFLSIFSQPLVAEESVNRYGAVTETPDGVRVESGMTLTAQHSTESYIKDEALVSFDLVSFVPYRGGEWAIYVEGNTSPRVNGVSSILGEANADAGSALDRDSKGRLQVSEFNYSYPLAGNILTMGMLDPAGVLDASVVANDETTQFLAASFVNNPTIAMPDYTLGASYYIEAKDNQPGYSVLVAGSHGLADNPNASYSELVDVGADGKGMFLGGEVHWPMHWPLAQSIWRIGAWLNSAEFDYLDGSGNTGHSYGAYLSTDYAFGERYKLNIRAGLANADVSEAADFLGLALETRLAGYTAGIGIAHTGVSDNAGVGFDDTMQAEAYMRVNINKQLQVTPSVQWIENSAFVKSEASANPYKHDAGVFSLRLNYVFL